MNFISIYFQIINSGGNKNLIVDGSNRFYTLGKIKPFYKNRFNYGLNIYSTS